MEYTDRYIAPKVGSELSVESFKTGQSNNTYRLAPTRYYNFYASYVRPRIQMYRGWVEGFHNIDYGILPSLFLQKIGNGIVSTIFNKPIVLNTQEIATAQHLQSKEYKKAKIASSIKESYGYALEGCAGLLKINKDGEGHLRFEALPMDQFFVTTDAYGDIEHVKCFVATYHDTINANQEYYLCEERFFRYAVVRNEIKRFPMVHYTFYKTSSNITYETTPAPSEGIQWKDIPHNIRMMIARDFGDIQIDIGDCELLEKRWKQSRSDGERNSIYSKCTLLPFDNDLGCRLIKFTQNIPAFPKMPFGQSLADLLMNESYQWDQLKFFERVEVYTGRSRVMVDEGQVNPNDPDSRKSALDPLVFTYYDNVPGNDKDGRPILIQPEFRAEAIRIQKQNILNDTAFALGLSSTTIASWLSDGTTQKTATEIEYERTKTTSFINEKIEIIREPLQELIDIYFHYYGLSSPELNIMGEPQTSRNEAIKLYSELYDKNQITSKMLAEKILGTCSIKEVNELANFIEAQKQQQIQAQPLAQPGVLPPSVG